MRAITAVDNLARDDLRLLGRRGHACAAPECGGGLARPHDGGDVTVSSPPGWVGVRVARLDEEGCTVSTEVSVVGVEV